MTQEQITLFTLFAAVFALLLWGRWRYDLVAFGGLMVGVLLGVVPAESAFSGFGHPATLVVALVLVVSAGLMRSGAVFLLARNLIDAGRSAGGHIAIMGGVAGALSAFMNNFASLALFMPLDIQTARKAGRPPGLTLMPLSFATILGGMVTLIGTPPNIIVASIREGSLGAPFAMFDFAPVGGAVAVAGIAFVALLGWRLIPTREGFGSGETEGKFVTFVSELTVPGGARHTGSRIADLEAMAEDADAAIIGLVRRGKRLRGGFRNRILEEGDALVVEAVPEALDEFRAAVGFEFAEAGEVESGGLAGEDQSLIEVVVPEQSRINGKTAQSIGLGWRQNTALLGISRKGKRITERVRKTRVEPGDILLLLTPRETASDVTEWLGALQLADRGLAVTADSKVWLAIALFAGAVTAASVGLVYLPVALGCVAVAYVLAGILPLAEIYEHIEWPVVVLLGSMIPLGAALETSGGTELIAGALTGLTSTLPAWAVLTVLMAVTMTLSDVLDNTATTIVAAPVAIEMARVLGVSPDPFLMAVAVGASAAFLTPIGHKNNTLILGPGGYGFGDYWRMGLPLEIIVVAVAVPAILLFWPL